MFLSRMTVFVSFLPDSGITLSVNLASEWYEFGSTWPSPETALGRGTVLLTNYISEEWKFTYFINVFPFQDTRI